MQIGILKALGRELGLRLDFCFSHAPQCERVTRGEDHVNDALGVSC